MRVAAIRAAISLLVLMSGGVIPVSAMGAPDNGDKLPMGSVRDEDVEACSAAVRPGQARCHARVRTDANVKGKAPTTGRNSVASPNVLGNNGAYDPGFLQSAYNLQSASSTSGQGQTVAIVDAYDAPNAEADLGQYRTQFGLPACTTANGCFRKLNQAGATGPLPPADGGWAQEISLDIDMVSAICPNCHILLVEANSNNFSDLGQAVDTAAANGANVISNSYGGPEFNGELSYEGPYDQTAKGVAVVASSGDSGYGVQFPAASRYVTAAGGTTLNQSTNSGTRNATETAWSGAGSGCSSFVSKPTWQSDQGCAMRTVADVAAVADPSTGVWVYDSYAYNNQSGWLVFGGTSVAAPVIGSIYALAQNTVVNYNSASTPYANVSSLFDIVSGSNGTCSVAYLCTSGPGFDGPTGNGSPNGPTAFKASVSTQPQPTFSMTVTPPSQSVAAGAGTSFNAALSSSGGYASAVNLSVSGLPAGASATFAPPSVTPSAAGVTSTLTVATTSATPSGTYGLTVLASGTDAATTTQRQTVSLVVSTPTADFSMTANPSTVTAHRYGQNATLNVAVNAINGYSSPVQLSVSGLPKYATATFSANPVAANRGATLTLHAATSTPRGTYTVTITGRGQDGTLHTTTVKLTVAN